MAKLSLQHIYKVYADGTTAVSDFNLEIEDGEFGVAPAHQGIDRLAEAVEFQPLDGLEVFGAVLPQGHHIPVTVKIIQRDTHRPPSQGGKIGDEKIGGGGFAGGGGAAQQHDVTAAGRYFFGHAAQAELAGFRPCLRCRPELAPGALAWSIEDAGRILAWQAARLFDEPDAWGAEAPSVEAVTESGEKMPTDKLVDVSPLALRMSSPVNAGYWLAAA